MLKVFFGIHDIQVRNSNYLLSFQAFRFFYFQNNIKHFVFALFLYVPDICVPFKVIYCKSLLGLLASSLLYIAVQKCSNLDLMNCKASLI